MAISNSRNSYRRTFSAGLVSVGAAGFIGPAASLGASEPPPETTRLRLTHHKPACWAPQYVAEELLRAADILIGKNVRKASERKDIVQALKEIPYGKWREYSPEDTVRFYALRLHELGMIESSPQEIIARNTDWRFIRQLKDELNINI